MANDWRVNGDIDWGYLLEFYLHPCTINRDGAGGNTCNQISESEFIIHTSKRAWHERLRNDSRGEF